MHLTNFIYLLLSECCRMQHTDIMKRNLNKEERGPSDELVVWAFEVNFLFFFFSFFDDEDIRVQGQRRETGSKWKIPSELVLLKLLSRIMFTTLLSFLLFSMVWTRSFDTPWRSWCQIIQCLERYGGLYPPTSKCKVCDFHAGGVRFQRFL